MKVKDILSYLDSVAPLSSACDFDNVGLLVGVGEQEVNGAMLSLDCTENSVNEAVEKGCQLIITHHPLIFSPLKNVLADSIVYKLIQNGISVIAMHTNLDIAKNIGVSKVLCNALDVNSITDFPASDGFLIKSGVIETTSADRLAEKIKTALGGCVRYVDGGKKIKKVLVCSGSGGEFISDAIENGFDALITAEVKHHQFLLAEQNGVSLFDGGHFNTEDIVIEPLCRLLKDKFNEISFYTNHQSEIKFK